MGRMAQPYTVVLQGFGPFERAALASYFRLAAARSPAYRQVDALQPADFVVADADVPGIVETLRGAGRLADTVFVGEHPPPGALACLARPIDPRRIEQALDALLGTRLERAVPAWAGEPAHVDLLLNDLASTASHPLAGRTGGGGGRPVLVVDDSGIARKFLALRLARLGYRVQAAAGADEALHHLAQQPVAIAFIDVVLGPPGNSDGLTLCRQLKRAGDPPAVVMVSGLNAAPDRVRGSLAGCDGYLGKPIVEAELIDALRRADPAFARAGL